MNNVDKATSTSFQNSRYTQLPEQTKNTSSQTNTQCQPQILEVEDDFLKALVKFVGSVSNVILDELENDSISKAFIRWNGFEPQDDCVAQKGIGKKLSFQKLYDVMAYSQRLKTSPTNQDGIVRTLVQIDWNASESLLVAVYGNEDAVGFSNNPGLIEVWEFGMNQKHQSRVKDPISFVEYECELTCVKCHPQNPEIFAVGSKNGEIVLYHKGDEGLLSIMAVSKNGQYFHDAAITCILWNLSKRDDDWHLFSMAFDGKVLVWDDKLNHPIGAFLLKTETSVESEREHRPHFVGSAISIYEVGTMLVICIGCDCGHLLVSIQQPQEEDSFLLNLTTKWSPNALKILKNICPTHRDKVIKRAESQAKLKKKKGVDTNILNELGIPMDMLFPSLPNLYMSQAHWGKITSVHYSNGTFLSTGEDCLFNTYDVKRLLQGMEQNLTQISSNLFDSEPFAAFCSEKVRSAIVFHILWYFDKTFFIIFFHHNSGCSIMFKRSWVNLFL